MGHVSCVPGTLLAYKCAGYTAPINCFPPYANALHDPADRPFARPRPSLHSPLEPLSARTLSARVCLKLTRVMVANDTMGLCASHTFRQKLTITIHLSIDSDEADISDWASQSSGQSACCFFVTANTRISHEGRKTNKWSRGESELAWDDV